MSFLETTTTTTYNGIQLSESEQKRLEEELKAMLGESETMSSISGGMVGMQTSSESNQTKVGANSNNCPVFDLDVLLGTNNSSQSESVESSPTKKLKLHNDPESVVHQIAPSPLEGKTEKGFHYSKPISSAETIDNDSSLKTKDSKESNLGNVGRVGSVGNAVTENAKMAQTIREFKKQMIKSHTLLTTYTTLKSSFSHVCDTLKSTKETLRDIEKSKKELEVSQYDLNSKLKVVNDENLALRYQVNMSNDEITRL